jgi:predicted RNase H-like nuclease (RuvC/YqgF family)
MLLRICLIVAILGGGAVAAVNFVMVQKDIIVLRDDRDTQKTARESAEKDAKDKKTKLDAANKELTQTKATLTQTKSDLAIAKAKVQELDAKSTDLAAKLKDAQDKRDALQADLAKFEQLQITPDGILQLRADLKKTQQEIAGVNEEKKILNTKVIDLTARLRAIFDAGENVQEPANLTGHVVAVDPKFGFVILDIGYDQNVVPNGIMMVAHEGKFIGKVQIVSVTNNQCVANILPAWRQGEVMEHDQVLD